MADLQSVLVYSDSKEMRQLFDTAAALGGFRFVYKGKKLTLSGSLFAEKFSAIVIEISKPAISEVQFVDFIHDAMQGTPIIIVSQYFMDTKSILFGNKVKDYLFNPITAERLLEKIRNVSTPQTAYIDVSREIGIDTLDDSRKLSMILEISRSLSSKTSLNDVLNSIINIATETFNAERATVFIVSSQSKELWSKAGTGLRENEIKLAIHRGIAGYVAETGISQVVNSPNSHPKFDKEVDYKTGFKTSNILCVPIRNIRGEILGVFEVLNKINSTFTLADEVFLSAIATSTGIALENAALHEKIKEQLSVSRNFNHELYSAIEKTAREARNSVIFEITNYLMDEQKSKDIEELTNEIKKLYPANEKLASRADKLLTIHNKVLTRINEFLVNLKI